MFAANTTGDEISVILGGTLVELPNNNNLDGFVANANNTLFTVPTTGRYFIDYKLSLTVGIAIGTRISVNGTALGGSDIEPLIGTEYDASLIADLTAGDNVGFEIFGLIGVATLRAGVGASLNIIRVS
ncbi:MAG: hypothetical protein M0Q14_00590 [Tissierellaceae bacterium]|nr:hypothetical protein [Tissierellaceae bacterium]